MWTPNIMLRDNSYRFHLFDAEWCDNVAEAVQFKTIMGKYDEVADDWKAGNIFPMNASTTTTTTTTT